MASAGEVSTATILNKDLRYTSSHHFGPQPPAGASADAAGRGSPGCFFGARKNCTVSFGLPFATGQPACQVAGSGWPSTIADGNTAARPGRGSTRSIPSPFGQSSSGQLRNGGASHQRLIRSNSSPSVME